MRQQKEAGRARDQLADDPKPVDAIAVAARRGARHAEHHQRAAAERRYRTQREERDEVRHQHGRREIAGAERDGRAPRNAPRVDAAEPQIRRQRREAERAQLDEEVRADLRRRQPELRAELPRDGGRDEQQERRNRSERDERGERAAREDGRAVGRRRGRQRGILQQCFHGRDLESSIQKTWYMPSIAPNCDVPASGVGSYS